MSTSERHVSGYVVIFPTVDVPCASCGQLIPAGEPLVATNDPGHAFEHLDRCPRRWEPVVIDGGRTGPPPARPLPLLEVVSDVAR